MAVVIDNINKGPDAYIEWFSDGSLVFNVGNAVNPKIGFQGFWSLAQMSAPALSPAGTAYIYLDPTAGMQISLNGAAYQAFGATGTPSSITQGGGTVSVDSSGDVSIAPNSASTTGVTISGKQQIVTASGSLTIAPATTLVIGGNSGSPQITTASGSLSLVPSTNLVITPGASTLTFTFSSTGLVVGQAGSNAVTNLSVPASSSTPILSLYDNGGNEDVRFLQGAGTLIGLGAVANGQLTTADLLHLGITGLSTQLTIDCWSNTAAFSPLLDFRRARGNSGTPAGVQSGNALGEVGFDGYNGTAFTSNQPAAIGVVTTETWGSTNNGTQLQFYTTATGTQTRTAVMTIDSQNGVTLTIPLSPANGGVPSSTAGKSSFVLPTGPAFTPASTSTGITGNTVIVYLIYIPFNITVTSAMWYYNVGAASSSGGIGIYSLAGNKLVDASGQATTTTGGASVTVTGLNVTLSAGWYYMAWTMTNSTNTFQGITVPAVSSAAGGVLKNAVNIASAANTASAGTLPSTLGTLSNEPTGITVVPYLNLLA
jgi:hypothetical protein